MCSVLRLFFYKITDAAGGARHAPLAYLSMLDTSLCLSVVFWISNDAIIIPYK